MPFKNLQELPADLKSRLSLEAQRIYAASFNSAWEQYRTVGERQGPDKRREIAHQVAWDAVSRATGKPE